MTAVCLNSAENLTLIKIQKKNHISLQNRIPQGYHINKDLLLVFVTIYIKIYFNIQVIIYLTSKKKINML